MVLDEGIHPVTVAFLHVLQKQKQKKTRRQGWVYEEEACRCRESDSIMLRERREGTVQLRQATRG